MAAYARPSARPSSRRGGFDDQLATAIQHNPSDTIRLGKRTHKPFTKADISHASKKRRLSPPEVSRSHTGVHGNGTGSGAESGKSVIGEVEPHAEQSRSLNPIQEANPLNTTAINGNKSASADAKPKSSSNAVKESDRRTLRSQNGGSRSKSELSWYFPNYEELINDEPKEPGTWIIQVLLIFR